MLLGGFLLKAKSVCLVKGRLRATRSQSMGLIQNWLKHRMRAAAKKERIAIEHLTCTYRLILSRAARFECRLLTAPCDWIQ